jgi:hypothetical protein
VSNIVGTGIVPRSTAARATEGLSKAEARRMVKVSPPSTMPRTAMACRP